MRSDPLKINTDHSLSRRDDGAPEAAEAYTESILRAVNYAAGRFLQSVNWRESLPEVLERLGRATRADRVYLFENHAGPEGERLCSQRFEWTAPGIPPQRDNPALQAASWNDPAWSALGERLARGEFFGGLVKTLPPIEREFLAHQGIRSILIVPVFSDSAWWGFIGFDDCRQDRAWSEADCHALKTAADIAGAALARQRAEDALRRSEANTRALLDAIPDGMIQIHRDGTLMNFLGREEDLRRLTPEGLEGKTIRDLLPELPARLVLESIKQTLLTSEARTLECRFPKMPGRFFELRFGPCGDDAALALIRDSTERKQTEEALRAGEARFRIASQCASDLIYEWDMLKDHLEWFGNIHERLGYAPGELPQSSTAWELIIHPEDYPRIRQAREDHLATGEPFFEEYRVVRKDGQIQYWTDSGTAVASETGPASLWIGANTDITERKRAEEALGKTEDLYRRVIRQTGGVPYHREFAHAWYEFLGEGIEKLTGFTPQELTGPVFSSRVRRVDYFGPEKELSHLERLELGRRGRIPFWRADYLFEKKNGELIWLSDVSVHIIAPTGEALGALGILTDITERKQSEEALRESEQQYRLLIENVNDGIVISQNEYFVFFNRRFAEMLGYAPEELKRKNFREIYTPESIEILMKRKEQRDRGEEVSPRYETVFRRKDGTRIHVEANVRVFHYKDTPATFAVIRDATERKRLEEQLRQAQKMEAVGQLAGGIAHDFNNLLTGILGNLNLARLDAGEELQPMLEEAERAGQRAAELIRQLLAFSRKSTAMPQATDLAAIMAEVAAMARKTFDRRIEIVSHCQDSLYFLWADPGQIHQVLLNLCVNARDAVEAVETTNPAHVPRITLAAENILLREDYCLEHSEARQGRFVLVSVSDTGVGIDEESQTHIFEPFYTTKQIGKGTGLGLATVYGIVKQHGGWINLYSVVGKGSTFKLYLPAIAEAPATPSGEKNIEQMPGGTETILLVDDEAYIRRLGRRILERLGYTILEATDGCEAVELYGRGDKRIDLAILDLSMPRLSGVETLMQIKGIQPDAKVILSSGYARNGNEELPERAAGTAYILKPYRPADLARTVRRVLDARENSQPVP
jgi:PAS domain S-box-containing protein